MRTCSPQLRLGQPSPTGIIEPIGSLRSLPEAHEASSGQRPQGEADSSKVLAAGVVRW